MEFNHLAVQEYRHFREGEIIERLREGAFAVFRIYFLLPHLLGADDKYGIDVGGLRFGRIALTFDGVIGANQ